MGGFLIFLLIPIELLLNTIATITLPGLPDNPKLALRTYTAVYLIREAYIMLILRLWLEGEERFGMPYLNLCTTLRYLTLCTSYTF